jgi:hypothetical protein
LTSTIWKLDFAPEISVNWFLLAALAGVLVGYVVRFFVKLLGAIEPPPVVSALDSETSEEGPITRWVKRNYYFVDCLVTMVLGFMLLVGLTQDRRPPQKGTEWYTALAIGFGIGLLTHSELVTRLKPPGRSLRKKPDTPAPPEPGTPLETKKSK